MFKTLLPFYKPRTTYTLDEVHQYVQDIVSIEELYDDGGHLRTQEYNNILHVMREVLERILENIE